MSAKFERFVQGYAEAMLWANTRHYETEESEGTEVEPHQWQHPGAMWALEAFDEAGQASIIEDCKGFVASNLRDLVLYAKHRPTDPYGAAGHDFALTRNHHGAGFWDRGLGDLGDRLTKAAHPYGSSSGSLYGDSDIVTLD